MATNYIKWLGEKFKTIGTTEGGQAVQVALSDGAGIPIITDQSGALPMLTEFQAAVHAGESFSYAASQIGLASAGVVTLLGRTGTKQVHFDGFKVTVSNAPFRIELFEAPTVSNAGTLLDSRRRNRANANVSLMTIYSTPIFSATGLILDDDLIPQISQGAQNSSGQGTVDDGWVLKANTDYLIRLTNLSGGAVNWSAKFTWHEANYNV